MSQSNAKLVFPNASIFAWTPFMQEVRLRCYEWANWVDKPLAVAGVTTARKAALLAQLNALIAYLGGAVDGMSVIMRNSTQAKTASGFLNLVNGVPTTVTMVASGTIVTNGQALTGVTPTGSFVTTVTFAVAGGLITGVTLS